MVPGRGVVEVLSQSCRAARPAPTGAPRGWGARDQPRRRALQAGGVDHQAREGRDRRDPEAPGRDVRAADHQLPRDAIERNDPAEQEKITSSTRCSPTGHRPTLSAGQHGWSRSNPQASSISRTTCGTLGRCSSVASTQIRVASSRAALSSRDSEKRWFGRSRRARARTCDTSPRN